MGRKGTEPGLIVKGGSGVKPGKPGRAADRRAGEGIVGVQNAADHFRGRAIFMSGHGNPRQTSSITLTSRSTLFVGWFARLAQAEGFANKFKDVRPMGQAVEQGSRQTFLTKNLDPVGET